MPNLKTTPGPGPTVQSAATANPQAYKTCGTTSRRAPCRSCATPSTAPAWARTSRSRPTPAAAADIAGLASKLGHTAQLDKIEQMLKGSRRPTAGRTEAASDGDPQAPQGLRGAHRPRDRRRHGRLLHPQQRALPVPVGAGAATSQRRPLHRPGRDARAGPDRARLRASRSARSAGSSCRTAGDRHDGHRPRVQDPHPHRRQRAAASEDRPEGHVPRGQPGLPLGPGGRRTGSRSRSRTRCRTSTPTRSTARSTQTRGTTCSCSSTAPGRASRVAAETSRRSSAASSPPTATWRASPSRWPRGARTCAA